MKKLANGKSAAVRRSVMAEGQKDLTSLTIN
jgi:hypothetical protein